MKNKYFVVSSRGRILKDPNNDNWKYNKKQQKLELQTENIFNTLTTVLKDNYVLIKYE